MIIFAILNSKLFKNKIIMRLHVKSKLLVTLIAFMAFSFAASAQTLEDAQKAYNAGVTAKGEGNIEEAIKQFTSCVEMCEVLYEEEEDETAEELMYSVQAVIPGLYLKLGSDQITAKQITAGVETLNKTIEVADSYGDGDTKKKAEKYLTQVHYKVGASKYKAGELDAAITELNNALAINPNYVSAYYLKSVVYKKKGDDEAFKATALKGIEVADAKGDSKNKAKIAKLGNGHFLKKGNDAKGASKYDEAIANLNTALEFAPTDATTLYLLSTTYLAKGSYANAIDAGNKAVENEKGNDEAKAKVYMTIAEAQTKKGDNSAACATYKKAAVGQYAELANYRIEHELKCE